MNQVDSNPDEAVQHAARWIADQTDIRGRAIDEEAGQRFGLTAVETAEALRLALALKYGGLRA